MAAMPPQRSAPQGLGGRQRFLRHCQRRPTVHPSRPSRLRRRAGAAAAPNEARGADLIFSSPRSRVSETGCSALAPAPRENGAPADPEARMAPTHGCPGGIAPLRPAGNARKKTPPQLDPILHAPNGLKQLLGACKIQSRLVCWVTGEAVQLAYRRLACAMLIHTRVAEQSHWNDAVERDLVRQIAMQLKPQQWKPPEDQYLRYRKRDAVRKMLSAATSDAAYAASAARAALPRDHRGHVSQIVAVPAHCAAIAAANVAAGPIGVCAAAGALAANSLARTDSGGAHQQVGSRGARGARNRCWLGRSSARNRC